MTQRVPLILRLVASSVSISNRAGIIIRDVMSKGNLGIVEKGINDYQTEADRSAQLCIIASLARLFPNITIIGEEECNTGYDSCQIPSDWIVSDVDLDVLNLQCPKDLEDITEEQVTVWVDPLDGTSEYTQGLLDHVTVLIGIAVNEKSVAGVIHQPYYGYSSGKPNGRTLWGIIGAGVGGFQPSAPPKNCKILVTTRSHFNPTIQTALDALNADQILRVGGAGHKVLMLIEGKAHAYVFASNGCKRWDTCAPEAVLHATGGLLTDFHGNTYQYDKNTTHQNVGGVLATASKADHAYYLNRIPDDVKQLLT